MKDNDISAFPVPNEFALEGMTLRDYFAAKASEDDIKQYIPRTMGDVAELLVSLKIIPPYKTFSTNVYSDADYRRLRAWARFQHADAMLAERAK